MTNREVAKHIDAFKYWCETNEENGVITIPKFLCEHIVEILDDKKEQQSGEWIPCSERLPKKFGVYLVTTKEGNVFEYDYNILTVHLKKWSYCGNEIIAWMPLPEPYKKEGDEE